MNGPPPYPLEPPLVDAVTKPWWDATRRRELVLQTCRDCHHRQHYPRSVCTACGSESLGFEPSSGTGSIVARTTVHRAPHPDLHPPYDLVLVDLDDGPRLLSRLVRDDPNDPTAARVTLDWWPLPDGRALPTFRPADDRSTTQETD